MPQIEIHPDAAASSFARKHVIPVLPPTVRDFGYAPDITQLLPGDLILSRSRFPRFIDNRITASQNASGLGGDHGRWTHAAVLIEEDLIVEALPVQGIVQHSIYSYVPSEIMRVRRSPSLSPDQRHRIALQAMKSLGKRYSRWSAIKLGFDLARGLWNKEAAGQNRFVVICSQLYFDCVLDITRTALRLCPTDRPTTPAHLVSLRI